MNAVFTHLQDSLACPQAENAVTNRRGCTIDQVAVCNGPQETPECAPWFGVPIELWTLKVALSPTLIKHGTFDRATIEAALAQAAEVAA